MDSSPPTDLVPTPHNIFTLIYTQTKHWKKKKVIQTFKPLFQKEANPSKGGDGVKKKLWITRFLGWSRAGLGVGIITSNFDSKGKPEFGRRGFPCQNQDEFGQGYKEHMMYLSNLQKLGFISDIPYFRQNFKWPEAIKCPYFNNLSTTTIIASYPFDFGNRYKLDLQYVLLLEKNEIRPGIWQSTHLLGTPIKIWKFNPLECLVELIFPRFVVTLSTMCLYSTEPVLPMLKNKIDLEPMSLAA
ncbi:hypothetical protein CR513_41063, partial [Mucuna pruriens]